MHTLRLFPPLLQSSPRPNVTSQKSRHHRFRPLLKVTLQPPLITPGAGPAGLVTAKTLLHNFPPHTFIPTIFEKRSGVGGLWPGRESKSHGVSKRNGSAGPVNPFMRTNLSRFTVGFSDFSWESVLGLEGRELELPMFPRAWEVGWYLEEYAERYIPFERVRLRCEVVRTARAGMEWRVEWVGERFVLFLLLLLPRWADG